MNDLNQSDIDKNFCTFSLVKLNLILLVANFVNIPATAAVPQAKAIPTGPKAASVKRSAESKPTLAPLAELSGLDL